MRARDARFEVDEVGAVASRSRAGRCDAGREQGGTTGWADPLGAPRHLERGCDLDRTTEGAEPLGDRRLDELERRASDEGRQDLDRDRPTVAARCRRGG